MKTKALSRSLSDPFCSLQSSKTLSGCSARDRKSSVSDLGMSLSGTGKAVDNMRARQFDPQASRISNDVTTDG